MLSHDNLTWVGYMVGYHFTDRRSTDRLVSYLPLSHIAAQVGREGGREGEEGRDRCHITLSGLGLEGGREGGWVGYHYTDRRPTDRLTTYLPLSHIAAQGGREGGRNGGRKGECCANCTARGEEDNFWPPLLSFHPPFETHTLTPPSLPPSPPSLPPSLPSQIIDILVPFGCGGCVHFAQPDALRGSLVHTLR